MRLIALLFAFLLVAFGAQAQQFPPSFGPGATFTVPVQATGNLLGTDAARSLVTYNGSLRLSDDVDGMRRIHVNNLNGGAVQAALRLENNNGSHTWFVQESPTYSNGFQQPNSVGIIASTGQPFWLATNQGPDAWNGPKFDFWLGRRFNMSIDTYGFRLHSTGAETFAQAFFNTDASGIWASIFSGAWDSINMTAGAYYHWGWIHTGAAASLINMNSDNSIGFYTQGINWVRNAYFDASGLHMPQMNNGGGYALGVNGSVQTWARPWNNRQTIESTNVYAWVPNGTCHPISYHSGLVIVSEDWYWGLTCSYILGGNGVQRGGYSDMMSPSRCLQGDPAYITPGGFMMGFSGGWYWLCNGIGADTYFRVMMLMTRGST